MRKNRVDSFSWPWRGGVRRGPVQVSQNHSDRRRRRMGLPVRRRVPPAGSMSPTARRSWSSTSTKMRSSARSRSARRARLRRRPEAGPRLRQQRPGEQGHHRRPEDAADDRQGRHGREPGLHSLRPGSSRSLHVQRPRPLGHRLRGEDRQGDRHHPARRQARVRGFRPGRDRIYNNIEDKSRSSSSTPRPTRWRRTGRSRRARKPRAWPST